MPLPCRTLTAENWQDRDPAGRVFVKVSRTTGVAEPMSGDDWAQVFLAPALAQGVPEDVAAIYEAARGVMLYGYYFYPLYAMGVHHLYRAAEAALNARFDAAGGPKRLRFEGRIDWLRDYGAFDAQKAEQWHATRRLRNSASHPTFQNLIVPGETATLLGVLTKEINGLFVDKSTTNASN